MIKENVEKLLTQIPKKNKFGEDITIVAAVKTQTCESINECIKAGISVIGDNHVQEFKDKYDYILGNPKRHFIGHLQTNKIKYLLGKCDLYHSIDRMELAVELNKKSESKNLISNILIQVNIGNEETKSGFELEEAFEKYEEIKKLANLKVKGFMAMLPISNDLDYLKSLAIKMRELFDKAKENNKDIEYLSMGMSSDYNICIECGSNMIRVGTSIFGPRNYNI